MAKLATECAVCEAWFYQKPRGRKRIFCCGTCRQRAFVRRRFNQKFAVAVAKNNEWYDRLRHDYHDYMGQQRKQTS